MRHLTKLAALGVLAALILTVGHQLGGAGTVSAQTYTGPPLEKVCTASGGTVGDTPGSGAVLAGGSVTCLLTADVSAAQGNPFIVTPIQPAGATITACASSNPNIVATGPGQKLPTYLTNQSPTGIAQTAIGNSTLVPGNTCAYTWLPNAFNAPAGTVLGTETFTTPSPISCGSEITRQSASQFVTNGNTSTTDQAGNPITFSDVGFSGVVSGGFLACGAGQPVVDTGIPAQKNCVASSGGEVFGNFLTCTITSNLFLATGSTLTVTPVTPAGTTVTACSSSAGGIVATGPGGTLPAVTGTILPFLPGGNSRVTFQAQLGSSTTVPANTCAFTSLGGLNPAGIGANTVVGTETISVPAAATCGTEITQRASDFIPNQSGVINPLAFPTTFPQTAAATISGGFLCRSGSSTTSSAFTNTGAPTEDSCATAALSDTRPVSGNSCTSVSDVGLLTGDTVFVTATSQNGAIVTGCASASPLVVATGPGGMLPVFTARGIVSSNGPVQAAALDAFGNTITTVPANTCAFTVVGSTPPGVQAGSPLGSLAFSSAPGTTTFRANVYRNVAVSFGFGTLATDGPGAAGVPVEIVNDVYRGNTGMQSSGGSPQPFRDR